jgi:hypothetical protein
VKSLNDAFAGFNGFLTQRQRPLDFEVRYKSGIFWLAFRETYPQVALTVVVLEKISAIQPEASAAPLAQRQSKLLIDFFWQVRRYNFQPLIDQLHADVDVAGCLGIIKPASPSRRFVGPLNIGPSF